MRNFKKRVLLLTAILIAGSVTRWTRTSEDASPGETPLTLEKTIPLEGAVSISSVWVNHGKNVLVADLERFEVREYDFKGNFKRAFGAKGRAPGKFTDSPMAVARDGAGATYAAQYGKILVWDREGKFREDIPFQGIPRRISFLDGHLIVAGRLDHTEGDGRECVISVYEGRKPVSRMFPHIHINGEQWSDGALVAMDAADGLIYAMQPLQYRVRVYSADGVEKSAFGDDSFYVAAPDFSGPKPVASHEFVTWMQSWSIPTELFRMSDAILVAQTAQSLRKSVLDVFDLQGKPVRLHLPWNGGVLEYRDSRGERLYAVRSEENKDGQKEYYLNVYKWRCIGGKTP
jgi:hypothetical protein